MKVHLPRVSVILTSYNHERYINNSIESVLEQTFRDFELIVLDDASDDGSWEIINSFSDKRIRAYRNDERKESGNIERALTYASGEYIAIHHSDDLWLPHKLEKQVDFLDSNPGYSAVFCYINVVDGSGRIINDESNIYIKAFTHENRSRHEWLNYFFYQGNAFCHPTVLIRKKCYDEIIYDRRYKQRPDYDFWIRLLLMH